MACDTRLVFTLPRFEAGGVADGYWRGDWIPGAVAPNLISASLVSADARCGTGGCRYRSGRLCRDLRATTHAEPLTSSTRWCIIVVAIMLGASHVRSQA